MGMTAARNRPHCSLWILLESKRIMRWTVRYENPNKVSRVCGNETALLQATSVLEPNQSRITKDLPME